MERGKNMYTSNYVEKFRQVIMSRFREVNAEKGHVLPQAWLTPFLSKIKNGKLFLNKQCSNYKLKA